MILFLSAILLIGCEQSEQLESIDTINTFDPIEPIDDIPKVKIIEAKEILEEIDHVTEEEIIDAIVNQQLILEDAKREGIESEDTTEIITEVLNKKVTKQPTPAIPVTDDIDTLIEEQENARAAALAEVNALKEYIEELRNDADI